MFCIALEIPTTVLIVKCLSMYLDCYGYYLVHEAKYVTKIMGWFYAFIICPCTTGRNASVLRLKTIFVGNLFINY